LERCDDYLSERKRLIIVSGKRKTAIAKAVVKPGVGKITVNGYPIDTLHPEIAREKIKEPLLLAGDKVRTMDIKIKVNGGGFMSQAEAVRMALVRGLIKWTRNAQLKRLFSQYERTMLAGDPRRSESKKFGGPGPRRRKQKSYR
jgi:small subunit ribosomal protein S9